MVDNSNPLLENPHFHNLRFAIFNTREQYNQTKETDKLKAEIIIVEGELVKFRPSTAAMLVPKLSAPVESLLNKVNKPVE